MDAMARLELFQLLFKIFVGIAILGLGLSVLFFIRFRVPELFALMTGRAQKKTLEKMRRRQAESGGSLREKESTQQEMRASGARAGFTGGLNEDTHQLKQRKQTEPAGRGDAGQTSMLQEDAAQTSLLEKEAETSLLSGQKLETTVLSRGMTREWANAGQTEQLSYTAPLNSVANIRFEITEETILTHTDETI